MRQAFLPDPGYRCVIIEDLRLELFIGVHAHEHGRRQQVAVTVAMFVPEQETGPSDDIADHVSYADMVEELRARAQSTRHVNLVETLAEEIAGMALADTRIASVIVDVRKTAIIPEAKSVGVIIRRVREQ